MMRMLKPPHMSVQMPRLLMPVGMKFSAEQNQAVCGLFPESQIMKFLEKSVARALLSVQVMKFVQHFARNYIKKPHQDAPASVMPWVASIS